MEVDKKIISEMPIIIKDSMMNFGVEVLTASAICYLSYRILKFWYIRNKIARLCEENMSKMRESSNRIRVKTILCEDKEDILNLSWKELSSKLKSGELAALSVLRAYQSASLDVQEKTNAIVAWVEGAEEQAMLLDSLPASERGPLHGIPISVKECYDVSGTYSTAGMSLFARNKPDEDSPAVKLVKKLGGIPYCKTNVPQAMYSLQCSNPIYGTSMNPHGNNRECGGSSGGEGALIGGRGSILGIGSDVGGSLRNPAAFCGLYSLKPTAGRHLSQLGVVAGSASPIGITVVGGYMSQSAQALTEAWKNTWEMDEDVNPQKLDSSIIPMKWNQETFDKKPKIGYFDSYGLIDPVPGCKRAVSVAIDKLKNAGFEVVKMEPPNIDEILNNFNGLVLAELNQTLYKNMSYDLYDSTLRGMVAATTVYKFPWIIKKLVINPLLSLITKVPPVKSVFNSPKKLSDALASRDALIREYMHEMDNQGVDVIICPGQMLPAPPTGVLGTLVVAVIPYIAWNLMNFPAGIAPVTKWSKEDETSLESYPTNDLAYRMIKKNCMDADGLPLAVQVVGRPFKDEQVLNILSTLE